MRHGHERDHAAHVQTGSRRVESGVESDRPTCEQARQGYFVADLLDETALAKRVENVVRR
jgi:hypothetical protein